MLRWLIGKLGRYFANSSAKAMELKLSALMELEIPKLRRELQLEQAENQMLKEKRASWRMEIQKDAATKAAEIANA